MVKNLPASAGAGRDMDLIPRLVIVPGEGHGNPFQYSCLENSMDRGAWQATVYVVAKRHTSDKHFHFSFSRCFGQESEMIRLCYEKNQS